LADLGISESRMRAIGYAANQPVTDNTTVQGRLRNRRVEIEILP
jgi:chemotaxis protein MotB